MTVLTTVSSSAPWKLMQYGTFWHYNYKAMIYVRNSFQWRAEEPIPTPKRMSPLHITRLAEDHTQGFLAFEYLQTCVLVAETKVLCCIIVSGHVYWYQQQCILVQYRIWEYVHCAKLSLRHRVSPYLRSLLLSSCVAWLLGAIRTMSWSEFLVPYN